MKYSCTWIRSGMPRSHCIPTLALSSTEQWFSTIIAKDDTPCAWWGGWSRFTLMSADCSDSAGIFPEGDSHKVSARYEMEHRLARRWVCVSQFLEIRFFFWPSGLIVQQMCQIFLFASKNELLLCFVQDALIEFHMLKTRTERLRAIFSQMPS